MYMFSAMWSMVARSVKDSRCLMIRAPIMIRPLIGGRPSVGPNCLLQTETIWSPGMLCATRVQRFAELSIEWRLEPGQRQLRRAEVFWHRCKLFGPLDYLASPK